MRRSRGSTQAHTLDTGPTAHVTYTATADLAQASVKAAWGAHGKISLRFVAKGGSHRLLPPDCKGKPALTRRGVLTGTLKVKLDNGFFRTIRKTRLAAELSTAGAFVCGGPEASPTIGPGVTVRSLGVQGRHLGGLSADFLSLGKGRVHESVSQVTTTKAYVLTHAITASAPHSAFRETVGRTGSVTSAKVQGRGPFLGGTAVFRKDRSSTLGTISGSFVARFDSIGRRRFAARSVGDTSFVFA